MHYQQYSLDFCTRILTCEMRFHTDFIRARTHVIHTRAPFVTNTVCIFDSGTLFGYLLWLYSYIQSYRYVVSSVYMNSMWAWDSESGSAIITNTITNRAEQFAGVGISFAPYMNTMYARVKSVCRNPMSSSSFSNKWIRNWKQTNTIKYQYTWKSLLKNVVLSLRIGVSAER